MEKQKKIELIKKSMRENKYPLEYKGCINYWGGNCYKYAIGSNYKENSFTQDDYIYNLGCISNSPPPISIETAEKAFLADMEVLQVQVKKSNLQEQVHEGEWKVVLFYDDYDKNYHDFHFARQDVDGNWSNQESIDGPIRGLGANPENCTDYSLVGYYTLKLKN